MCSHSAGILSLLAIITAIFCHERGISSFIWPSWKVLIPILVQSLLRIVGVSDLVHAVRHRELAGKARRVSARGVRISLALNFHEMRSLHQLLAIADVRIRTLRLQRMS